jgi:hypothetical protein
MNKEIEKYSQRDERWANLKINNTKSTIRNYGCFVTCLAMLSNTTPDIALDIIEKGGGFKKDLIVSDKAAKALKLDYFGKHDVKPQYMCIAEVDMSPSPGKQQHFVIFKNNGYIIDPWDGAERPDYFYKIISFRYFRASFENIILNQLSQSWHIAESVKNTAKNRVLKAKMETIQRYCHNAAEFIRL